MMFSKKARQINRTRKIFQLLKLPKTGKVLDVSCGGGRLLKTIENQNPDLELHGVDITPGYLAEHPELSKINFQTAPANALPFSDHEFEIIVCALSIHHYENISEVLSEMRRVAKPGSKIYLVDFFPERNFTQWILNLIGCHEPYHFEKFYTTDEFIELAQHNNLKFELKSSISTLPPIRCLQFTTIN